MKMFFENWLWKLILCVFPVTKAGGWSEEGPIVISFSLRSPSSDSVLLSVFPKNPFISTFCLNWESVSAAQFLLVCLKAVVCVSCNMCMFLGGFVNHCSQPCLSHGVLTKANPYVLWWEFKVFPRWVFECRNSLAFRERGRWIVELSKSVCSYYFLVKDGTRVVRETQLVFHWRKSMHFLFIVHQSTQQ